MIVERPRASTPKDVLLRLTVHAGAHEVRMQAQVQARIHAIHAQGAAWTRWNLAVHAPVVQTTARSYPTSAVREFLETRGGAFVQ